jgi:transposase
MIMVNLTMPAGPTRDPGRAYAVTVRATVAVIATLNAEIATLQGQVEAHFGRHPDAEIYRSQPGLGEILGARVLGEFGDDPHRYHDARARKNYAGTSPITRASGKKKVVLARYARNDRLGDALHQQASAPSPPHQAPGPTTTNSAPAAPATTPPSDSSATAWSASCTAV